MQKSSRWELFWPRGSDRNAQIWVGGYTFPCPILNKIQHIIMDTAQTIFDRMVRAACGFESEYVRDGEVDLSAVRPRDALLAECSILTEKTSCGLCYRAKGPPGRAWFAKQTGRP